MKRYAIALAVAMLSALEVHAAVDMGSAASIVVLDRNRKKPLDTYARTTLLQFSGRRGVSGSGALAWVGEVLLDEGAGEERKVFLADNPSVAGSLNMKRQRRRYSYKDVSPGLARLAHQVDVARDKPNSEWTSYESDLMRLSTNVREYAKLASGLSFLDPHPMLLVRDSAAGSLLGLPVERKAVSYWELLAKADVLSATMERAQADSGSWSATDSALVRLSMALFRLKSGMGNPPPHIIPVVDGATETWYSPWGLVTALGSRARENPALLAFIEMRRAYRESDQVSFDHATSRFAGAVESIAGVELPSVGLEVFHNRANPVGRARIALGLGMLLALLYLFAAKRPLRWASLGVCSLGLALLSAGMAMRMVIMARPPVTNLYETFVFVAYGCALLGLVLELMQANGLGVLIAGSGGFAFLHVAARFGLDGDTMGMLSAVLNNNFWLATHIMTIGLGYAGCAAAAVAGHVYLTRRMLGQPHEISAGIDRAVYGMLLFGLVLTVVGTVLGGLWADQAWGRFWGWDPKENGALLIILWASAVVHARRGKMVAEIGTAVGSILLFVFVMFAWLGVNLLGVGMHAYGFTTRGTTTLFGVVGGEALFLLVAWVVLWRRDKATRRLPAAP